MGSHLVELAFEHFHAKVRLRECITHGLPLVCRSRARRRGQLDDGVCLQSDVLLARQRDECVRCALGVGELRVDAHRGRLVFPSELHQGDSMEGQLRHHTHSLELASHDVEELVVVECTGSAVGRRVTIGRDHDRDTFLADHAAHERDESRRVVEQPEVRHEREVDASSLTRVARIAANAQSMRRALRLGARALLVGVPHLDGARAQVQQPGAEP